MGSFSVFHWIVVLIIVVLLFGTKKLPELGTGLGKAISNFKKSFREGNAIDVTPENDKTPPNSEGGTKSGDQSKE